MAASWQLLIDEYRALLVSPASRETLERSLRLMVRVVPITLSDSHGYRAEMESLVEEERRARRAFEQLSDDLRDFSQERWEKESLKRRRKLEYVELQELCVRTSVLLQLPKVVRLHDLPLPEHVISLAFDVGMVIFHNAYFWLIDALPKTFEREAHLLVGSFHDFAEALTGIPDALRVRALILELAGDPLAGWYWREQVRATNPDSHEFMTALQSAWSHEIESGDFVKAMVVLADAMDRVPERHVEELRELIDTTIELSRMPSVA